MVAVYQRRIKRKLMTYKKFMMAVMCAYFFGVICGMGIMIKPAFGHEDHGFKHMTETSGSIVKEKYCGADISIWWIDNNLD